MIKRPFFAPLFVLALLLFTPNSAVESLMSPTELFISEYVEGGGNNKAIEIYNGTGSTVNLSSGNYVVNFYFNGNATPGSIIPLTGSVADGDVYVLVDEDASGGTINVADQIDDANFFNGNDLITLTKNGAVIDSFGEYLVNPDETWPGLDTMDHTLRRKNSICFGDTDETDYFNASIEWTQFGKNNIDDLGSHTVSCDGGGEGNPDILINEVDADTESTDDAEFIELYGDPNQSLDGLVLVLFNGNGDVSYDTIDLDGQSTDGNGYFVACVDANNVDNCDLDDSKSTNLLQNGADAVALYTGSASDFPNGTSVTAVNLIDAIVYDTDDSDDSGLISVLTPSNPQVNESEGGSRTALSNQRCPNGSGDVFETSVYDQFAPTPGSENQCSMDVGPVTCNSLVGLTPIYDIQGSGLTSPLVSNVVNVKAIVTGDFQNNGQLDDGELNGFYLQEESGDGSSETSDGIFVLSSDTDVSVGDLVLVRGTVTEFETSGGASSMTELTGIESIEVCSSNETLPTAANVSFPLATETTMERYEGMLVNFPQALVISEYFNYDRFGEMVLSRPIDGWERPLQPTAYVAPGVTANSVANELALNRITLDDGLTTQNPSDLRHPNGNLLTTSNLFRGGDTVANTVGVIDDTFGKYRIQPTGAATYTSTNPRTATPADVGGNLKVVSLNVQNYFLTIDNSGSICGAGQNLGCRGADTNSEFERQRAKLLLALLAIDADIYGIVEIENTPGIEPLADLVTGMNDVVGANTFDYIDTGVIGSDAIRVGIIYKTTAVSPIGDFELLDSSVDSNFLDNKNRPVLAQFFEQAGTGERLTVAVNHLKSKGSACDDVGDPDAGDGQGNCNDTRTDAAVALASWLATDPTGFGDPDVLILGDLNSYDKEDPIQALEAAGYTDLAKTFNGEDAYSYVFDGAFGYLDYALANASLKNQVVGVTEWHINADEADIWGYDESFNDSSFYEENVFRVSDHDPIIVGIGLNEDLSNVDNVIYLPLILNGQ